MEIGLYAASCVNGQTKKPSSTGGACELQWALAHWSRREFSAYTNIVSTVHSVEYFKYMYLKYVFKIH